MPVGQVNPVVVKAMNEKGIDISQKKPKMLTAKKAMDADLVVTMGCSTQDVCPSPFFVPTVDWVLEAPKINSVEKVREIRDLLSVKFKTY